MSRLKRLFSLKSPCANCPFLKVGAIQLNPGRLDGIKADLLRSDFNYFLCHKTTHSTGGEDSEDGEYYSASGKESHCAGAAAFLLAHNSANMAMRLSFSARVIKPSDFDEAITLIDTSAPVVLEQW